MSFSAVDIFFFLILVIFIIRGTFKGFVGELFGKLSFIIGILCAILLNGIVGGFILKKNLKSVCCKNYRFFYCVRACVHGFKTYPKTFGKPF